MSVHGSVCQSDMLAAVRVWSAPFPPVSRNLGTGSPSLVDDNSIAPVRARGRDECARTSSLGWWSPPSPSGLLLRVPSMSSPGAKRAARRRERSNA